MPAASALLSPWCDITRTGDGTWTLAGLDPTLDYTPHLEQAAAAYAGERDRKVRLVSPLHADYRPGISADPDHHGHPGVPCARLASGQKPSGQMGDYQ